MGVWKGAFACFWTSFIDIVNKYVSFLNSKSCIDSAVGGRAFLRTTVGALKEEQAEVVKAVRKEDVWRCWDPAVSVDDRIDGEGYKNLDFQEAIQEKTQTTPKPLLDVESLPSGSLILKPHS